MRALGTDSSALRISASWDTAVVPTLPSGAGAVIAAPAVPGALLTRRRVVTLQRVVGMAHPILETCSLPRAYALPKRQPLADFNRPKRQARAEPAAVDTLHLANKHLRRAQLAAGG